MTTETTATLPKGLHIVNGEYVIDMTEQLCRCCTEESYEDVWVTSVVPAVVWSDLDTHEVDYEDTDTVPFCPECGETALYDSEAELLEDLRAEDAERRYDAWKDGE